jgi:hypothetical protein
VNPSLKIRRDQLVRLLDGQRVQLATSVGLFDAESDVAEAWQPLQRATLAPKSIEMHRQFEQVPPDEVWVNDIYQVFVYRTEEGGAHLSIKRNDRAPIRNWRHFQQMKNEICGEEIEALELFPRESRLADNANQYHVWALPPNMEIPLGFPEGFVTVLDEEVASFNAGDHKGRQEPRPEGITVGDAMQAAQERDGLVEKAAEARAVFGAPQ